MWSKIIKIFKKKKAKKKKNLLTMNEKRFFFLLKEKLKDLNIIIVPKVRVLDIITPEKFHPKLIRKLALMHVDFVICDNEFNILGAIELDDSNHYKKGTRKRDKILNFLFYHADLPLIRVKVNNGNFSKKDLHKLYKIINKLAKNKK